MPFEDLKKLPFEEQVPLINEIMRRVTASGKPAKRSKTFKEDSGLGVCLSEVEKHMRSHNYVLEGNAFVLKTDSKETNIAEKPDMDLKEAILELYQNSEEAKKKSLLLYPRTVELLDKVYAQYPYFHKTDIVNALIQIGVSSVKD